MIGQIEDWYPCLDHDLASLAYTAASLFHGSLPWSGFENRLSVLEHVKKERLTIASDVLKPLLEKGDASTKVKQALLNAIGLQGNKKAKRAKLG